MYLLLLPWTLRSRLSCARQILQCHSGFQELYRERTQHFLSPQDQIYHTINNHTTNEGKLKDTLEKVTVVGHSLGGGNPAVVVAVFHPLRYFPPLTLASAPKMWLVATVARQATNE